MINEIIEALKNLESGSDSELLKVMLGDNYSLDWKMNRKFLIELLMSSKQDVLEEIEKIYISWPRTYNDYLYNMALEAIAERIKDLYQK